MSKLARWIKWIPALLLWLLFAQAALIASRTSLTTDEGLHITSGYSILQTGDYRLVEEHPPLTKLLMAAPLLPVPDLPDVRTLPGWESETSVLDSMRLVHATQSLIYTYQPIDRLVVAARLPCALLAVLLGAVVFRWASDLAGRPGGLLALLLLSFDPNVLAHASVAGTDLGAACFITLAMFAFWRFVRRPTWARVTLAGVTLGMAQAAKLSSLLLLPVEALIVVWLLIRDKRKTLVAHQVMVLAVAALTLWAVYRFEIGRVPGVPFPVPAASHAIPWLRLQQHIAGGHAAFLMGQISSTGWWYYFPVAFALKTPLPTLLLLGLATVSTFLANKKQAAKGSDAASVWLTIGLFPLIYFASSMANPLNIGYRHLLPMLPFLLMIIAMLATRVLHRLEVSRATLYISRFTLCTLFIWYALGTLRLLPHYLAFFNEIAGGAENGWRYLADSNTDWGQALKQLALYQREHKIERARLSMFTFFDPAVYGVNYEPLTPMQGNTPAIFPSRFNPPPGDYVISATTLQGIPLADPEMFDWFREREPEAKIGYVMFVYRVQPETPRRDWLAQCTTPVAPLEPPQITEGCGRANLRLAYFDCSTSWLYPTGGQTPGWYALARQARVGNAQWLAPNRLSYEQKRAGFAPPFRMYATNQPALLPGGEAVRIASSELALPAAIQSQQVGLPVSLEGGLDLLGYRLNRPALKRGEIAYLETVWRVSGAPNRLLSLMAQALAPDGRAVAVGDGLGVPIESWQPGDVFVQRHALAIPQDAPVGTYWLQTGVYWLDNGQRWPVRDYRVTGDRVLITTLDVRP